MHKTPELFHSTDTGQGDLVVLRTRATAHPNGSDELSVYENGIATRRRNDPVERQQRQPNAGCTYSFFEGLCRTPKGSRCVRLMNCYADRSKLGVVHLFEIHEVPRWAHTAMAINVLIFWASA